MQQIHMALEALRFGGAMVYPLLLLAVLAVVVILDKAFVYWQFVRLPQPLLDSSKPTIFHGRSWTANCRASTPVTISSASSG